MRKLYEVQIDPLHHATMTSSLLDAINQIASNNDSTTNHHIPDLIAIAAERARDLMDMLDAGEVQDDQ